MKLTAARKKRMLGFDMTPMIDVVLQLIIFFLFTSQFGRVSPTPVDLPRQAGERDVEAAPADIVVDLLADGSLELDGRPITRTRVVARASTLRASGVDPVVIVRADRAMRAGPLNDLAVALSEAGVRRWRLATEPAGGG
ncbi:MAG: biopolymer transporter ExbD [Planctomycetota bacterium]